MPSFSQLEAFLREWMISNEVGSPAAVNSGLCEEFAGDLARLLPGAEVVYTESFIPWDDPSYPGGHSWVSHEGLFYDAESLAGVKDWRDLQFFVRRRGVQACSEPCSGLSR